MFHRTQVMGRIGKNPEMKFLPSGTAVVNTSIAVTEKWTDRQSNEKREKTTWYDLSVFGARAEAFNKYVKKGDGLFVEGNVEAQAYMGNDGQPRASLKLKVNDWHFVPGSTGSNNGQSDNNNDSSYDEYAPPSGDMDDIPF